MSKKILLGFSGGLDTSYCVKYLIEDLGYEVHSILVDTGGFSEAELQAIENKAIDLGVTSHHTENAVKEYYDKIVKYLVYGNVLKNNTYPLSVSAERMTQAIAIANYAKELAVSAIAHGSTGAGNDQVRFDMIFQILVPELEIITPIRDLKLSRELEIDYLKSKGLWGTSVGGKETLTSHQFLPQHAFPTEVLATTEKTIVLYFQQGELYGINDNTYAHPTDAIKALQAIASPYGIGRDIHVGDTIIGIKGRGGFEAAAPLIIIKAHHTLEKHVLTKWQLMWKDQIASFYGHWLHEGQILDPIMRDIEAFLNNSQQQVTGTVSINLMPYRYQINGIESDYDLMNNQLGTYGEMNSGWTGQDVRGFTKIFGNQVSNYFKVKQYAEQKQTTL
jgi:argininosuccinate synthase